MATTSRSCFAICAEADDLRVLDFNGQRAFGLFHLSELGSPIFVENGRAGEAG